MTDLARSWRFYEQGLGWVPSAAGDNENVTFYQLGGIALALFSRALLAEDMRVMDIGKGFGAIALAQNVRTREEVDQLIARAKEAGGSILHAAEDAPWGGYSGYFADPDGQRIEVMKRPSRQRAQRRMAPHLAARAQPPG